MIPAKASDLIEEVAQSLDMPREDLASLINLYYKEVRLTLENLDYLHLRIGGLGIFTIKGWKLDAELAEKEKSLERCVIDKSKNKALRNIERYKKAQIMWAQQRQEQYEQRVLKRAYYKKKRDELTGKDTENLGE